MLSNLIESFTVCARTRFAKSLFLLALSVLAVATAALPRLSHAQSAEPAAAAAAAAPAPAPASAAPAAAAPALDAAAIEARLGDLEAYINNGARVSKESKVAGAGPGHNAWMMTCAALVLFMTLPGLALFYGGLVRTKNVLSVMAQCLGSAGLVTILWVVIGYSLCFSPGTPFLGGTQFAMLANVDAMPNGDYSAWVSENVFAMYQLMFAIITPALIVGAIAERMKFSALMLFMGIWMFVVYFPLAHMVWGVDGFMNGVWNANAGIKAIDFAGGTVVHMSSGWSAIVLALIVGKRKGFGKESFAPHSLVLTMIGTGMLWVGWYGFNAGSAVAADSIAANAFMTTTIATAVACAAWPAAEWITRGKPTVLGFCSGAVGGLVVITPAAGFVTPMGAIIIGVIAGIVPYLACTKLKQMLGYDDALDTFGVHAVGGTIGALLTGFLADAGMNPNLDTNLKDLVGNGLWLEQLKAMGLTITLAVVATVAIGYALKATIGLRPNEEDEQIGLDLSDHGEQGYHTSEHTYGHLETDEGAAPTAAGSAAVGST
ncbi:MAG TPA: ammonium transporter [Polyangiaceae bacterium]|nr:ammonium transporter [Polyangiaceae bacterium]